MFARLLVALVVITAFVAGLAAAAVAAPITPPAEQGVIASDWVKSASARKLPKSRWKLPKQHAKVLARVAAHAQAMATKPLVPLPPQPKKTKKDKKARAAQANPMIEFDRKSVALPNGVTLETLGRARVNADETISAEFEMRATDRKGETIVWRPELGFGRRDGQQWGDVGCPTADGRITAEDADTTGGTISQVRANKAIQSVTDRIETRTKGRGRVGRDAHVDSIDVDVTIVVERYERGGQLKMTLAGTGSIGRDGVPHVHGRPSVTSMSLKIAGLTAAQERAAARQLARDAVNHPDMSAIIARKAVSMRKRMNAGEWRWYQVPNYCAHVRVDPRGATLEPGKRLSGTVWVEAENGGGASPATISLAAVKRGTVTLDKADADPGAPATFTATGAEPDAEHNTAAAEFVATSRAGRAGGMNSHTFWAVFEQPPLPERFTGTISNVEESGGGTTDDWTGQGTWTRTSVLHSPDGSTYAWYELTSATLTKAKSTIGGPGCRYEATTTGGRLESGDIEIHIRPDGRRVYGFLFDMKAPIVYEPKDCDPEYPPPPMDGEAVAYFNMRPFVAAPADWHLTGAAGAAPWDLRAG